METKPDISAIVMAFNEVKSLEPVVKEIDTALDELNRSYEIVIVDDGSSDGTEEIANRLAEKDFKVRVIRHEINKGLGGVYRTGFQHATGDFITFFPADGQFPADIMKKFVPLMDNMDMVLGYLPKRDGSMLAKYLSMAERVLLRLLFGPVPRFQGITLFRRKLLRELELKSAGRGWTIMMELIIKAQRGGYRMMSVPTELRPRISGRSKVNNLSNIWANLIQTIALRRHFKKEKTVSPERREVKTGKI